MAEHRRAPDEVDRIIAAWREVRPDLDVSPLAVLSRVSRVARHLDIARGKAFSAHGLEAWEFDVLSALRRQGPPFQLSPGALTAETLVTSGTMTNRIGRLRDRGLVLRLKSPQDGRGALVELTPAGLERVDGALETLLELETALLSAIPAAERATLARLLRGIAAPLDS